MNEVAPAQGRAAGHTSWRPEDLRHDQSWRQAWTQDELAEFDRLARRFESGGLPWDRAQLDDVEAPLASERLDCVAHSLEWGVGFAVIGGFPVDRYSADTTRALLLWIGERLGWPKGQNAEGNLISSVTDTGVDYAANVIARGYLSSAELQPHTDGGDISGLLCVRQAKAGGETLIASSLGMFETVVKERPELLPVYQEGFRYYVRDADGQGGFMLPGKVPVYFERDGVKSTFMVPRSYEAAAEVSGIPLEPREVDALQYIQALFYDPRHCLSLKLEPGELLLFSNWTNFHARNEFDDHMDATRKRLLYRLWIHARIERIVPDAFGLMMRSGLKKRKV